MVHLPCALQGKSPYVRGKLVDGVLEKPLSFHEAWPINVDYVIMCATDNKSFGLGKTKGFVRWLAHLNSRYIVADPKRTCKRILFAIEAWMAGVLIEDLAAHKFKYGEHSLHLTGDHWTSGKSKNSFGALVVSMVVETMQEKAVDPAGLSSDELTALSKQPKKRVPVLEKLQCMIDFEAFDQAHSAQNLARWYKCVLARYGLTLADIGISTLDGASNGQKALRLLYLCARICFAHNLQRSVLYALGIAGKPSQNEDAAACIAKNNNIAAYFHRSTKVRVANTYAKHTPCPMQPPLCFFLLTD